MIRARLTAVDCAFGALGILITMVILFVAAGVQAQIASGQQFSLSKAVLGGGGSSMQGGTFTIEGTTGQPVAGQQASGPPSALHAGFLECGPASANGGARLADRNDHYSRRARHSERSRYDDKPKRRIEVRTLEPVRIFSV